MTRLSHLKLGLAAIGVILFGYGVRADDIRFRWMGIAFIAVAAILRFLTPRPPRPEASDE